LTLRLGRRTAFLRLSCQETAEQKNAETRQRLAPICFH
jgi:hypothetical protein